VLGTLNDCNGNLTLRPEADIGLSKLRAPGRARRDARIADFNGDGIPDLIANVYSSVTDTGSYALLFYGRGDGTFIEATPDQFPATYRGYGETIVVADFDNDGHLDVFLPNYTDSSSQEQNYLLHNRGDGTFVEIADAAGVANRGWPLTLKVEGVQAFDINGDGFLDLYAASHLYINNGDMTFTDRREDYGLPLLFDEGAKFLDWDSDGIWTWSCSIPATADAAPVRRTRIHQARQRFPDAILQEGGRPQRRRRRRRWLPGCRRRGRRQSGWVHEKSHPLPETAEWLLHFRPYA